MPEKERTLPFEKLYLVRVQNGLDADYIDETSALVLDRSGANRNNGMNSCHFTINAIVKNHTMGTQFDDAEYVIIAPFLDVVHGGAFVPSGLSAGDTWFHADEKGHMRLFDAQILLPDDVSLPPVFERLVTRYPRGKTPQETMANRNQSIEDWFQAARAPLFELGGEGGESIQWSDGHERLQQNSLPNDQKTFFGKLAKSVFPNYEIATGQLHGNSLDALWEALYSDRRFRLEAERYASGETKYQDDSFKERSSYDYLIKSMEESAVFIKTRKENKAPPHALAHYVREYSAKAVVFERTVLPARRREVEQKLTNDVWVYDGEHWGDHPLTAHELIELVQKGGVKDHYKIRQEYNGEVSLTRYGGSYNQTLIESLKDKVPSVDCETISAEPASPVRPAQVKPYKGPQYNR